MKLTQLVFKQHNIGQVWGRFALASSQIAIFVSGYTLLMVSTSSYNPISTFIYQNFNIMLNFGIYLGMVFFPILVVYLLSWKFLVRSFYLTWADQFWQQSKEYVDKLDGIKKQNEMILQRLNDLEMHEASSINKPAPKY